MSDNLKVPKTMQPVYETETIKELIEQEDSAADIRETLSFVRNHGGFPLEFHKQNMTREEMNAR